MRSIIRTPVVKYLKWSKGNVLLFYLIIVERGTPLISDYQTIFGNGIVANVKTCGTVTTSEIGLSAGDGSENEPTSTSIMVCGYFIIH